MKSSQAGARLARFSLFTLAACSLLTGNARAQGATQPEWAEVGRILKTADTPTGGYHRFNLPRRDLTIHVGDVTVATGLAFGSWAGFAGSPDDAMVMGDLVLRTDELKPVLAELARQHVRVLAVHNHLVGEVPEVIYVHFHASGRATELAARLDKVVSLTATPRPVPSAAAVAVSIDTAEVFRVLGSRGKAQGNVAQMGFMLVTTPVTMDGHPVLPALGYGSPINIQAVSPSRYVATGDFAVTGRQLEPLLTALAGHDITATAVHTHMVDESPRIYFVHFWADGVPSHVLSGLHAAIEAAR